MLNVRCSKCNKEICLPENHAGKQAICPQCKNTFIVEPAPSQISEIEPSPKFQKSTKACPFCGEEILEIAIKCKHCGEFMNASNGVIPAISNIVQKNKSNRRALIYGAIFVVSFLICFSVFIFIVPSFNKDENTTDLIQMNNSVKDQNELVVGQMDGTVTEQSNDTVEAEKEIVIEQSNEAVKENEIEQKYLLTLKPFADELRSMQNEWDIGMWPAPVFCTSCYESISHTFSLS